jgi:hypothetical protein
VPLVLFDEDTIARANAFKMGMTDDEWFDWNTNCLDVGMRLMHARHEAWREALGKLVADGR